MSTSENKSLKNFFEKATKQDYRLMNDLSNDHLTKLKLKIADSDIKRVYTRYEPVHEKFINNYVNWVVSKYAHQYEKKKLTGLLDDLTLYKLNCWGKNIQNIFPKGSKEYKDIFSEGKKPFQEGEISERINKLKLFADKLKKYKEILNTKKDINEFIKKIDISYKIVQKKEKEAEADFALLEESRKRLADMMYKNFCIFNDRFNLTSEKIPDYFNPEFVLSHEEYLYPFQPGNLNKSKQKKKEIQRN